MHASPAANRVGLGRNTNRLNENYTAGTFQNHPSELDNI